MGLCWGDGGVLGRLGSRLIIVAGRGGGELILLVLKKKEKKDVIFKIELFWLFTSFEI